MERHVPKHEQNRWENIQASHWRGNAKKLPINTGVANRPGSSLVSGQQKSRVGRRASCRARNDSRQDKERATFFVGQIAQESAYPDSSAVNSSANTSVPNSFLFPVTPRRNAGD